jgi:hypothetical protein
MPPTKELHRNTERIGWMVTLATFVMGAGYLQQQQQENHQEIIKEFINQGQGSRDRTYSQTLRSMDVNVSFAVLPPNDSNLGAAFWVSGQYAVMKTEISTDLYSWIHYGRAGDRSPYLFKNLQELIRFADSLSITNGFSPCYQQSTVAMEACTGWRIPTSNEWMLFANAGQGTVYSGSDSFSDVGWNDQEVYDVGTKPSNQWGVHDMSGGVVEVVREESQGSSYGVLGDSGKLHSMLVQSLPSQFGARLIRVIQRQSRR